MGAYATVRAPFAGVVTNRRVDPGAFIAPGAPMLELQDPSRLRVSVSVPPRVAASLKRGQAVALLIEDQPASGIVEGAVPTQTGAVYSLNAVVNNPRGAFLAGSAAVVRVPTGKRTALLVPAAAVVREGDLTGVRVRTDHGAELRWVRTGGTIDDRVEVLAGLRSGDVILLGSR